MLWEVPTEMLRRIQGVGILPLLALTREGSQPEVVDEALTGIEQSPVDRSMKDNLLTITLTLARLALSGPEDLDWLRGRFYMYQDLIRDTEIYQLIMQEGVEKQQKQEVESLRQMILLEIQERFPELAEFAESCTNSLADVNISRQLMRNIIKAKSPEEVCHVLERLKQAREH